MNWDVGEEHMLGAVTERHVCQLEAFDENKILPPMHNGSGARHSPKSYPK